jgi:hypothetical protein
MDTRRERGAGRTRFQRQLREPGRAIAGLGNRRLRDFLILQDISYNVIALPEALFAFCVTQSCISRRIFSWVGYSTFSLFLIGDP